MTNGAGFNPHPLFCDKYVQCQTNALHQILSTVMQCPFATFWSSDVMTCIPAEDVDCPMDPCRQEPDGTRYDAEGNCRGYWECLNGKSVAKCADPGYLFDSSLGFVENDTCEDLCFNEVADKQDCDKRAVAGDPTIFEQYRPGFGWQVMPCAPGTDFLPSFCTCAIFDPNNVQGEVCTPEVYLPFDKDTDDMSGNRNYVHNENVGVVNGRAIFDGSSRLIIPRFTNLEHSDTVVITATYTPYGYPTPGQRRALVSNADCDRRPSIMISETETDVEFGVRTSWLPLYVKVPQSADPVKEIAYVFNNGKLAGNTLAGNGEVAVDGTLRNVKCALHIGHAQFQERFVGEIEEMTIYLCKPKTM